MTCGVVVAAMAVAAPASAVPPEGWPETEPVSPMSFLLVLVLIPLGLAAVITLLALLPSMKGSDSGYQPGLAWRNEPEWFGGRREVRGDDAEPAEPVAGERQPAGERGGASARW